MKNRILLLLAYTLIQFPVVAQDLDSAAIRSKFSGYLLNNFQEKIYIHIDKDVYLAGEIIWIKVYCTEAYTNIPSNLSKIAYVEILNSQNKPVAQAKIQLKEGRGAGSFYLPVALESGNYKLRSYTNWMKNAGPAFFFQKSLTVYNTVKEEVIPTPPQERDFIAQFFPEGGNLVSGITSKVAFKVTDTEGHTPDFRGAILDGNDTIARIKPSKFGIGNFNFTPERSRSYRAIIIPVNGKPFFSPLPRIYESGVVMTVKRGTSALNVSVQSNAANMAKLTLFVHSGQKVTFSKALPTEQFSQGFTIPLNELGDGVSHLTLFDAANRPVCERLFFKRPGKLLNVNLSSDKLQYHTRERTTISVSQTNNNQPMSGDFSIAVYKADSLTNNNHDIGSVLWLTSELKGSIENPAWYFDNPDHDSTDDLMLTHGWRRFNWDDVLNEKKFVVNHLPELQGHIVSGRIESADGKPVANKVAFLSIPDRTPKLYSSLSDINGKVNFYTRDFHGSAEINAQPDPRMDSLLRVEINSPFSPHFADSAKTPFNRYPDNAELLKRSVAMQVNNIYHAESLVKERLDIIDTIPFYRKPDKVYKLDDYVRFKTMEEVLREYVPDVTVASRNKSYQLQMYSPALKTFHNKAPFTLIDGVPVFDEGNTIVKLDPRNIQRFEQVNDLYVYGPNVLPGILSFHTYKGDLAGFKLPQQALVLDYDGLQNLREFYSPMYSGDKASYSKIPDQRTTLFWSPDNHTDNNGKASIEFFTSDLPGKYQVVVQSLSANGAAGSKLIEFEVTGKPISAGIK